MSLPFDVSCHFNEDLHDVPNSRAEMQRAIEWLQNQWVQSDPANLENRLTLLGLIGSYARILHYFSIAEWALTQAVEMAEFLGSDRHKIANLIRLAQVYQWQRNYAVAEALFDSALAYCQTRPELDPYLDFMYQHLGKCKFDQAQYVEAQQYFEQAMELRLRKGERSLIESTQLALEIVQRRIDSDFTGHS